MKCNYKPIIETFVQSVGVDYLRNMGSFETALDFIFNNIKHYTSGNESSLKNSIYYYLRNYCTVDDEKNSVYKSFNFDRRIKVFDIIEDRFVNNLTWYRDLFSGLIPESKDSSNTILLFKGNPRLTMVLNIVRTRELSALCKCQNGFSYAKPSKWFYDTQGCFVNFYNRLDTLSNLILSNSNEFDEFIKTATAYRSMLMSGKYNIHKFKSFIDVYGIPYIKKLENEKLTIPLGTITTISFVLYVIGNKIRQSIDNKSFMDSIIKDISSHYVVLNGIEISVWLKYRNIIHDFLSTEYYFDILEYIFTYAKCLDMFVDMMYDNGDKEKAFGVLMLLIRFRNILNSNVKRYYQSVVSTNIKNIPISGV